MGLLFASRALSSRSLLPMVHLTALNDHVTSGPAGFLLASGRAAAARQLSPHPQPRVGGQGDEMERMKAMLGGVSAFAFQGTK